MKIPLCRFGRTSLLALVAGVALVPVVWAQSAEELMVAAKAKSEERQRIGRLDNRADALALEAVVALDRAIALKPDLPAAYLQRARARLVAIVFPTDVDFVDRRRPPPFDNETLLGGALEDLDRAITLKPDFAEALKERGDLKAGKLSLPFGMGLGGNRPRVDQVAAVADYTRAIESLPNYTEAYFARAEARVRASDTNGGADLDRAIALKPDFVEAYMMRAGNRRRAGDFRGAVDDLDHAIASDPPDDPATTARVRAMRGSLPTPHEERLSSMLSTRSAIKLQADDLEGAMGDSTAAIAVYPTNRYLYPTRGRLRQEKGDLAGAIADYTRFKELNGDMAGIRPTGFTIVNGVRTVYAPPAVPLHLYLHVAQLLLHKENSLTELKAFVAQWSESFDKEIGLFLAGGFDNENGLLAKAASGDATVVPRQQCQAYYYLGIRRLLMGKPDEARTFFERAVATSQTAVPEYRFARAELGRMAGP